MSEITTELPITTLVLDYTIYPRHRIDDETVRRLTEALRAGETFPPIVVDSATLRVIDGFHRIAAVKNHRGELATIPVKRQRFSNEAEMFAEAIRLNARHGRVLSAFDLARCVSRGQELGLDKNAITRCAAITAEKYEQIVWHKLALRKGEAVPIKRTLSHLAGRELTETELDANRRAGGMNQLYYVNQVLLFVTSKTVDMNNKALVGTLNQLLIELQKLLTMDRACAL